MNEGDVTSSNSKRDKYDGVREDLETFKTKLCDILPSLIEKGGEWWKEREPPEGDGFARTIVEHYETKRLFVCCDGT